MEEPSKKKTKMTKEEKEKKEEKNPLHVHSVKKDSKRQKGKKAEGSKSKSSAFTENWKANEANLEGGEDLKEKKRKKVAASIENSKAGEVNMEKGDKYSKKKKRKKAVAATELQYEIAEDTPLINASAFQPIEPAEKTHPAADQDVPEGLKETTERQLFLKEFTGYVNELRIKLDWVDSDQIGVLHEQWRSFQVAESEARKRKAIFNETLFKSTLKAFNSR